MREICPATTGASPYLTDISKHDKPWDKHRRQSEVVQELYLASGNLKLALRMYRCSRQLVFVLQAKDEGELRLRLRNARFCRVRHCPTCQWRKSLKWTARIMNALPKVQEEYPKGRWIFVTLTVANMPITEMRDAIADMNKAFSRLTKRKEFPAIGFIRALEVTREEKRPDYAHPHFHVLMLVKPSYFTHGYLSKKTWQNLWASCLKVDYLPVVDVKVVTAKDGSDSLIGGVLEVAKYTIKPEELMDDAGWLYQLTKQLHQVRSITVGGVLKEYIKDEEPDDLINIDEEEGGDRVEEEEVKIVFNWKEQVGRYIKRD